MPNNEGIRRQPPQAGGGGVGRGKTLKSLPLNSDKLAKRRAKTEGCNASCHQRAGPTCTYFPGHHLVPRASIFLVSVGDRSSGNENVASRAIMYAVRIVNVCFLWSFQRLKTPKGRISHSLLQYKRNNRDHWHMVLLLFKTQIQSLTFATQTKLKIAHVNFKLFKIVL